MARQTKLIYALKDGEITSIADVESGLKCGCVCPACGEPLVAKKGSKVMHHFAHHAGTNCEYGYQTSLHLAAKDILSKAKKMVIPAVTIDFPGTYKRERVSEEKEIEIDRVELERRFDDIIPDVVVYSGGKCFFVEIFVTHRVNDAKLAKLKKANISTIEMNLSKIEQTISAEELRGILLQHNDAKKWIYNASAAKWLNRFNQCAEKKEIAGHDFTQYVFDCPIQKHTWHGRAYARALEDCPACTYCIFRDDSCILCTGRRQVASIKDFSIPGEIRKAQRDQLRAQNYAESKRPPHCPICGSIMVKHYDKFGPFWGCSRYPDCDGKRSIGINKIALLP